MRQFSAQKVKCQRSSDVKDLDQMAYISRHVCLRLVARALAGPRALGGSSTHFTLS